MTDLTRRQRRADRRRAVIYFSVAGLLGACVGAGFLLGLIGPLAAALAVALATGTAAVSAALLSPALAAARADGRWLRAMLIGALVPVLAYLLFALAYGLVDAGSLARYLNNLRLTLEVGVESSVVLIPIGAVTGWLYSRGRPLAPEA